MVSSRRRVVLRRIRRALILLCLLFLALASTYLAIAFKPTGFGPEVLASDARVRVDDRRDALVFSPSADHGEPGVIFFPGCPVPSDAYAPFARAIAERGYPVFVMHVPYRCATLAEQQEQLLAGARAVMRSSPRRWILAGHSRGAVHASALAARDPQLCAGLVLIGTAHPRDVDLSSLSIPVMKIYGTRDGVAPEARIKATAHLLPPSTRWVRIEGGNHRQFGWYRYQLWDRSATISREAQQRLTVEPIIEMLHHASTVHP